MRSIQVLFSLAIGLATLVPTSAFSTPTCSKNKIKAVVADALSIDVSALRDDLILPPLGDAAALSNLNNSFWPKANVVHLYPQLFVNDKSVAHLAWVVQKYNGCH